MRVLEGWLFGAMGAQVEGAGAYNTQFHVQVIARIDVNRLGRTGQRRADLGIAIGNLGASDQEAVACPLCWGYTPARRVPILRDAMADSKATGTLQKPAGVFEAQARVAREELGRISVAEIAQEVRLHVDEGRRISARGGEKTPRPLW